MNDESNVRRDAWSYGSALIFNLEISPPLLPSNLLHLKGYPPQLLKCDFGYTASTSPP